MILDPISLPLEELVHSNLELFGLLDVLLKSALVMCVAILIVRLLHKQSPSTRNAVLMVAFSVLLFLPLFQTFVPHLYFSFSVSSEILSDASNSDLLSTFIEYKDLFVFVYLSISSYLIVTLLTGLREVFHLSKTAYMSESPNLEIYMKELKESNGISSNVSLLISESLSSPVTFGILNHKIILPESALDWSEELQRQALSHELGHILRNDWVQQIVVRLVQSIYWINPLVWIAGRQFYITSEMSCDDIAVDDAGSNVTYAENLLWLVNNATREYLCAKALLSKQSVLSKRIHYILDSSANHKSIDRNGCIPGAVLAISFSALIASMSIQLQVKEDDPLPVITFPVKYFSSDSSEFQLFARELEQFKFVVN